MAAVEYRDDLPHLRRRGRMGAELRRVVDECSERAGQPQAPAPDAEAVHEARRALKRARAVLRLGEEMGVAGARAGRKRLAALARELSPRRDATIAAKVALHLAGKLGEVSAEPAVRPRQEQAWWAGWQHRLAAEIRRLARIAWGRRTAAEVRRALRKSAKRVCRRAKTARRRGDMASAHEWRKTVIALREQIHVVKPLLHAREVEMAGRLHTLAQRLGQAADYDVLSEAARKRHGPAAGRGTRLGAAARARRARALRKAQKLWPKVQRVLKRKFA